MWGRSEGGNAWREGEGGSDQSCALRKLALCLISFAVYLGNFRFRLMYWTEADLSGRVGITARSRYLKGDLLSAGGLFCNKEIVFQFAIDGIYLQSSGARGKLQPCRVFPDSERANFQAWIGLRLPPFAFFSCPRQWPEGHKVPDIG